MSADEGAPTTEPPPGQRWRTTLPRFGLWPYARRGPASTAEARLRVRGADGEDRIVRAQELEPFRENLEAAFHCVTRWSVPALRWSGFPMRRVWALAHAGRGSPEPASGWVMLRGLDGYRTMLSLSDLLADGVMLADRLAGQPLGRAHGAPWRLVAPAHYGYKQVKHLAGLTWCDVPPRTWGSGWRFMDHPRARVAQEERGVGLPAWALRWMYRPLVAPTAWHFERQLQHPAEELAKPQGR